MCGLLMMRSLGRMLRNTLRTQGDIVCVEGERKCTFSTITVTIIDNVTNIMVNSRYLPEINHIIFHYVGVRI